MKKIERQQPLLTLGLALLLSVLAFACAPAEVGDGSSSAPSSGVGSVAWPTAGWPTATPASEGVDPAALRALDAELRAGDHGYVDAFLVFRNGKKLADYRYPQDYRAASADYDQTAHQYNYYHPDWHPFYRGSEVHTMQSVTKSVTSTLIGIAIARGELAGPQMLVSPLFSDYDLPDPDGRKKEMTLEDLLTMRAGFQWDESTVAYTDPRNDCAQLEASEDWVQFVLDKPLEADPGARWVYNSGVSVLLSAIIKITTGQTIDAYAEDHLFGPLGIEEYHWKKTPKGLPDTEGGLYLRPEDLAKIGYLFLQDGVWEGERLLPEGWAKESTRPIVPDVLPDNDHPDDPGYGYQWWIESDGADGRPFVFAGRGYGGQFLLVAPELDLMVVFTGWNIFGERPAGIGLFFDKVLPAVS